MLMVFIKNLPIGKKILTIVIVLGFLQLITSSFAILKMNDIAAEFSVLYKFAVPLGDRVSKINLLQFEKSAALEKLLAGAKSGERRKVIKSYIQKIHDTTTESEAIKTEVLAILAKAEEQSLDESVKIDLAVLEEKIQKVDTAQHEYQAYVDNAIKVIKRGGSMNSGGYLSAEDYKQLTKIEVALYLDLEVMQKTIDQISKETISEADHVKDSAFKSLVILVIVVLAIAAVISKYMISGIVPPIVGFMSDLKAIAKNNDLSKRLTVDSKDEIGDMANTMNSFIEKLQRLLADISNYSDDLASSAVETARVSDSANDIVAKQKNETTQVAYAIDGVTSAVEDVTNNAQKASIAANEGANDVEKGRQVVSEIVSSINELNSEITNSMDVIGNVKSNSENIGSVLDVIKSIAEQTNLLALNAAIEAARAGEQGRGFAVVADEVRSLAQKTQDSTAEIENLISTLQQGSDNAVKSMDQNAESIASLVAKTGMATDSLNAISESVNAITDMNSLIAVAAEQQSNVVQEINTNVNNIHQMSEQSAQSSQELLETSSHMSGLSDKLKAAVQQFRL
jgi:methyl-accepting chemotaxis protein